MSFQSFLEMSGVRKRYGGVVALDGADFAAARGEVHALLGPNGSGKSTLLKTLSGVVAPDAGSLAVAGKELRVRGPRDAHRAGVAAVYQELSLLDDMSVVDNLVLGVEPTHRLGFYHRRVATRRGVPVLERFADAFGGTVPTAVAAGELHPGERQIVEICKALVREPRVLVLDEATASLRHAQVEVLFDVLRELRERGVLVVFTSHRLDEIRRVCERATILRGGVAVATVPVAGTSSDEVVRLMLGELGEVSGPGEPGEPGEPERPRRAAGRADGPVRLRVADLEARGVDRVSFEAGAGEVVGLGGLQGQGQSELLATLFGTRRRSAGSVHADGELVHATSPARAIAAGFAYVPGNRAREGLLLGRPIVENLGLPSLARRTLLAVALSRSREMSSARANAGRLETGYGSLDDPVSTLSGGNQQKIVIGKWFPTEPRVVLMDDPMKGIDVRAKAELFTVVRDMAARGATVVLSSSDDRELVELCDRVLVCYEGRVVDELAGESLTEDALVASALGVNGTHVPVRSPGSGSEGGA